MAHVLVGLDGSPESVAALRWASWFATTTGREVHVAHAWQRQRGATSFTVVAEGTASVEALEAAVEAHLRAIVEAELGDPALVSRAVALRGGVAESLSREAERAGAHLIVVGASGAGGALRTMLGSASRALTECPARAVAVVPGDLDVGYGEPWQVVVGLDGSTGSSRALRWAAEAARRGGGEVVAVHAVSLPIPDLTPQEQEVVLAEEHQRVEEEWCAPLRLREVAHRVVVEVGDAREVLRRAAASVSPACVAVGSRGLGPLSQRLLGSVTYDLVREVDWPVVVIPSPRDCIRWQA